jgi:hypothetical protein
VLPGNTSFGPFISNQLQAFMAEGDPAYQAPKDLLQGTVEGFLLAGYVFMLEQNPGQSVFEVIGGKLNKMVKNPALEGLSREEAARIMCQDLLNEVFGLRKQLPGVPPALQKTVKTSIQIAAFENLSPLLYPIIEKEMAKVRLNQASGSKFFGNLSKALAKDPFTLLPSLFGSREPLGKEIFTLLAEREPTDEELLNFIEECQAIVQGDDIEATPRSFLKAFYRAVQEEPGEAEYNTLLNRLEGEDRGAVLALIKKFSAIVMTPETIAEIAKSAVPDLDVHLQRELSDQLQKATRGGSAAYQGIASFAGEYIEGMAVRFFQRVAEKNPPVPGKDSFVVLTENLLKAAERLYTEAQTDEPIEATAQRFNDKIFKEVFGIDSEEAFEGFPEPVKELLYQTVGTLITDNVLKIHAGMSQFESARPGIIEAREELKRFGKNAAGEALAVILAEDITKATMDAVPFILTQAGPQGIRTVNMVQRVIDDNLDQLARGGLEAARLIHNYTKAPQMKTMLEEALTGAAEPDAVVAGKTKAAELVNGLTVDTLNKLFSRVVDFEDKKGAAFNRKLLSGVLGVVGQHLKTYNEAKKRAQSAGRKDFTFAEFIAASGGALHPAVPVKPLTFERSIAAINEGLRGRLNASQKQQLQEEFAEMVALELKGDLVITDKLLLETITQVLGGDPLPRSLRKAIFKKTGEMSVRSMIRAEGLAHKDQRDEKFFKPASENMLRLLFPNGKQDLTFIPDEMRSIAWKSLKTLVLPAVLGAVTETLLDEEMVKGVMVSILQSTEKTLKKEFVYKEAPPAEDPSLDSLDQASGELAIQLIDLLDMPVFVKNQIKDPKTGQINPSVAKSLGAALRAQFNGDFLKETIKTGLESAVERQRGKPTVHFTPYSDEQKEAKRARKIAEYDDEMKRLVPGIADASVSFAIESFWKTAQAKFDALIERAFGSIGVKLKKALDDIFNFVFFKIIGSIFSFLFVQSGFKEWLRNTFHSVLRLDENRERITDMLTKIPEGQPIDMHPLHNEDLVFKIGDVVQEAIRDAIG